jgi:hypothetical protein
LLKPYAHTGIQQAIHAKAQVAKAAYFLPKPDADGIQVKSINQAVAFVPVNGLQVCSP